MAGTKGGSGKTTTAVCLAFEAAARRRDVLLVDLDPQGTAVEWAPGLSKGCPDIHSAEELSVMCASHEYVVIDTPPGVAPQLVAALEAADVVLAVTGLGPGDMRGLAQLARMVDPDLIVPTRRDGRRALHAHGLEALRTRWPGQVGIPIPMSAALEWAQADQAPLPALSPPAIAYRALYEGIAALGGA
ncbi:MAG: ParA family protein [Acidimicrobiales bacterium]